jgi:Zn-dependent oligopeptidase
MALLIFNIFDMYPLCRSDTDAKRGPWIVKLTSPAYDYFMEYCPERALRWNTWQAHVTRASGTGGDKRVSNSIPIEEIRAKR